MNLFGRLLLVLLQAWGSEKQKHSHVFSHHFRVWLHDLGWRDHLPNYRFYSFMELGRFGFWHGTGLAHSGSYNVRMIAAQDFTYLRPVSPFAKFRCDTELMGWDQKYFYFRHNFYVKDKLAGIGLVKEACLSKGKVVAPKFIVAGEEQSHPVIESWQQLQQTLKG
jgi:acyl-CoA thioesterase FadM